MTTAAARNLRVAGPAEVQDAPPEGDLPSIEEARRVASKAHAGLSAEG
ncbi:hypothetical protein [Streptomyces sp. NRRL S-1813]|nr:hypothetical protein [Streptomyces sp. NRRL S-1813]